MPWDVSVMDVLDTSNFMGGLCYTYTADLVASSGFSEERTVAVAKRDKPRYHYSVYKRGIFSSIPELMRPDKILEFIFDPLKGKKYDGIKFDPASYTGVRQLPESSTVLTDVFDRSETSLLRIPLPLSDTWILKHGLDQCKIREQEYYLSLVNVRTNELIQTGKYTSVVSLKRGNGLSKLSLHSLLHEFSHLLHFS
jgi:hypothetical protein